MSLPQELVKALAVPSLCRCLTGRPEELRRLLVLEKIPFPSPLLRAFLKRLSRDLEAGGGIFSNLLLRIGRFANPKARRSLIRNLIFHWGVKGGGIRSRIRNTGMWVPFVVAMSPTMRCNLNCRGCYSGRYSRDGELSEADLDRLFAECKSIGNYFVVLTGGEPYLLKEGLLRLFRKHQEMYFLTFTNGTLFDERLAEELAQLGNVAPAISLEGFQQETDGRRGAGTYARILRTMDLLREKGVLFGISVTYTSENLDAVTSDRFLEFMMDRGALFAWYFMFLPVGKDPVLELVPAPEQRLRCGQRVAEMRKKYGLFMADFWNDGPAVAGCLAGARRYMHVLNSGRVEACVFAHFGVDNIHDKSLLEAANSPFFKAIRNAFPFNETGNLKRPCMIIDNPQVLRTLVRQYVTEPGHSQAEDVVEDPKVTAWVDDYAERFQQLTEPEWLSMIGNPESRWYKGKDEYQNLFTFGKVQGAARPPEGKPAARKSETPQ
jgi:MoaA/NifB/PqqE/SkfB family radical SAM enzyme